VLLARHVNHHFKGITIHEDTEDEPNADFAHEETNVAVAPRGQQVEVTSSRQSDGASSLMTCIAIKDRLALEESVAVLPSGTVEFAHVYLAGRKSGPRADRHGLKLRRHFLHL
jgi:hypothetical protein